MNVEFRPIREREALLDILYASLAEVPAWKSFLNAACETFSCDQAAIVIGDVERERQHPIGIYADHARADMLLELSESTWLRAHGVVMHYTSEIGQAIGLSLLNDQGHVARFVLWRTMPASPFNSTEADLLASLSEALLRGLRIYYRIADLSRAKSVTEVALSTSRIGVILAGTNGEIVLSNSIADEILAQGGGLHRARGHLCAETPAETAELLAEIRRRAMDQSADPDTEAYAPIALARSAHALPLTVIVRPGPAFRPLEEPLRRTAILVLRDPAQQAPWQASTIARLFGLSAAESVLARELARGASLEEAAALLGISRNTVRSQLQSIFLKTGLNRQSDLIRVLMSSAATSA
jgi:DNA-binding CsgD family transcriptional regulator